MITRIVFTCMAGLSLLITLPAMAQTPSSRPALPDETTQARLVWATMVAVDNANRTGNYSVVHSLSSPRLQAEFTPQDMAATFRGLRERRVDVGRALTIAPEYMIPPTITPDGRLRLRGGFEFRPRPLRFDLLYVMHQGGWRLDGVSIAEMEPNRTLR